MLREYSHKIPYFICTQYMIGDLMSHTGQRGLSVCVCCTRLPWIIISTSPCTEKATHHSKLTYNGNLGPIGEIFSIHWKCTTILNKPTQITTKEMFSPHFWTRFRWLSTSVCHFSDTLSSHWGYYYVKLNARVNA